MIEDLVPRVREALKVSSGYDADTIPAGIEAACLFLLREYDFPKTRRRWDSDMIAVGDNSFALPTGFIKPYDAKLMTLEGATAYYRDLPRGAEDALPCRDGPQTYSIVGETVYLDTPLTVANYFVRFWYKDGSVAGNEAWLTTDFKDIVFIFSTLELSVEMSKPEVMSVYTPLWERRQQQLGVYIAEAEFSDSEVVMRHQLSARRSDRYPTT